MSSTPQESASVIAPDQKAVNAVGTKFLKSRTVTVEEAVAAVLAWKVSKTVPKEFPEVALAALYKIAEVKTRVDGRRAEIAGRCKDVTGNGTVEPAKEIPASFEGLFQIAGLWDNTKETEFAAPATLSADGLAAYALIYHAVSPFPVLLQTMKMRFKLPWQKILHADADLKDSRFAKLREYAMKMAGGQVVHTTVATDAAAIPVVPADAPEQLQLLPVGALAAMQKLQMFGMVKARQVRCFALGPQWFHEAEISRFVGLLMLLSEDDARAVQALFTGVPWDAVHQLKTERDEREKQAAPVAVVSSIEQPKAAALLPVPIAALGANTVKAFEEEGLLENLLKYGAEYIETKQVMIPKRVARKFAAVMIKLGTHSREADEIRRALPAINWRFVWEEIQKILRRPTEETPQ